MLDAINDLACVLSFIPLKFVIAHRLHNVFHLGYYSFLILNYFAVFCLFVEVLVAFLFDFCVIVGKLLEFGFVRLATQLKLLGD